MRMGQKTIDKYHGLKTLRPSYKYIVKDSSKTLFGHSRSTFTFFHFLTHTIHFSPLFLYFPRHFSWCTLSSLRTHLDPSPIRQLAVEETGDQSRGAAGPFPRTATVAQLQKKGVFIFISCIS